MNMIAKYYLDFSEAIIVVDKYRHRYAALIGFTDSHILLQILNSHEVSIIVYYIILYQI